MAIYHLSAKTVSRSSGRSSVGAAAYRTGTKLKNERDNLTHDYTKRDDVEYTEIMAPDHAPEWATDRERLWNEVEKIEVAKNARTAREVEIALPSELSREQQIALLKEYTKENFVDKGMVADIALHDKGDGNPHAHILLTTRPFNEDGTWGAKSKKEYILDKKGERIKLESGEWKSRKIDTVDWNKKSTLQEWRRDWADRANRHLEKAGHEVRIDHRSLKDQGIERTPTFHEGPTVRSMEAKGKQTEVHDRYLEIKERNNDLEMLKRQSKALDKLIEAERGKEHGRTDKDGIGHDVSGTESRPDRADQGIPLEPGTKPGTTIDWRSVESNLQDEGDRVPKQPGNEITGTIQQQVRAVEERTNRITQSPGEQQPGTKQQDRGRNGQNIQRGPKIDGGRDR